MATCLFGNKRFNRKVKNINGELYIKLKGLYWKVKFKREERIWEHLPHKHKVYEVIPECYSKEMMEENKNENFKMS